MGEVCDDQCVVMPTPSLTSSTACFLEGLRAAFFLWALPLDSWHPSGRRHFFRLHAFPFVFFLSLFLCLSQVIGVLILFTTSVIKRKLQAPALQAAVRQFGTVTLYRANLLTGLPFFFCILLLLSVFPSFRRSAVILHVVLCTVAWTGAAWQVPSSWLCRVASWCVGGEPTCRFNDITKQGSGVQRVAPVNHCGSNACA